MLKQIEIEAVISTGEMRVVSETVIPGELDVSTDYCRMILDRVAKGKQEKNKKELCGDPVARDQKVGKSISSELN